MRPGREQKLLARARGGDEDAFGRLVEAHRGELHAHCYRMLGSRHDADDALQEALVRIWRGLARFEGRSTLRAWLYRIATNACLDAITRRRRGIAAVHHAAPADELGGLGEGLVGSPSFEPLPHAAPGLAAPEARYEQRERVESALISALRHLPTRQRAALILRDVLDLSAREVADALQTTTAAVNSALQRARRSVRDRSAAESLEPTLHSLGDEGLNEVVGRYLRAMDQADVGAMIALLSEEVEPTDRAADGPAAPARA